MSYKIGSINQIGAPAIITSVNLVGQISSHHLCAKTGNWREVFREENTINNELKIAIRNSLNSPTDYSIDNLFSTDGQKYGGGGLAAGDPSGGDGIIMLDTTHDYFITMLTVVHPSDPSGSYYRQWQGVITNDFGAGEFVISQTGRVGHNMNAEGGFSVDYAYAAPTAVTMATNDILTVNWKIAVG